MFSVLKPTRTTILDTTPYIATHGCQRIEIIFELCPQDTMDEICKKWFDENCYSWQIGTGSVLSTNDILDWVIKAYNTIKTKNIKVKIAIYCNAKQENFIFKIIF